MKRFILDKIGWYKQEISSLILFSFEKLVKISLILENLAITTYISNSAITKKSYLWFQAIFYFG